MRNYIKDMEAIDYSFTTIKRIESISNIEDIIDTMKRNHSKKNEVYSKMYELNNHIDVLQGKIDENKEYLLLMMEQSAKLNENNEKSEKAKRLDLEDQRQLKQKYENHYRDYVVLPIFSLEIEIKEDRICMGDLKKEALAQYCGWMEKAAGQNLLKPLVKEEIECELDHLPVSKYLGFLESITKKIVTYKSEVEKREIEEEKLKKAEKEAKLVVKGKLKNNSILRETKKSSKLSPTRATNMMTTGTGGFGSIGGMMDRTLPSLFKSKQQFSKV